MARALEGSACLAVAQGQAERALRLAGAAAHLRGLISAPLPQVEQLKLDQTLMRAWNTLSESKGKHAWEEGSSMSLEKAVEYSVQGPGTAM
jgi:hypothetical protein